MQVLYAIALIPAGFLADKTDRPRMLAAGLALWSLLTMAASKVPPCAFLCRLLRRLP
jgi:MFS family permease